jgi:hypothetical protein
VAGGSRAERSLCRPQALLELEMNSDLKAQLRELNITAAKVSAAPRTRTQS